MTCKTKREEFTTEYFVERAKAIHGNKYGYDKSIYISANLKLLIYCPVHREYFEQKPCMHLRGQGCAKCMYDGKRTGRDKFIARCKEVHGDKYDYSKVVYKNNSDKILIRCTACGEEYTQKPHHHLAGSGCTGRCRSMSNEAFIAKAIEAHGDKYDYSKVVYRRSTDNVDISCRRCLTTFSQRASQHLYGHGCPACAKNDNEVDTEKFIRQAKEIHGDRYDYSLVERTGKDDRVRITCRRHGIFLQLPGKHTSGGGCRKCRSSHGETRVMRILENLGIKYEHEWKPAGGIYGNFLMAFDLMLTDVRAIVEVDGKQHFEPVEKFGGKEAFAKVAYRDLQKTKWAVENGYRIIRIGYHEINQAKEIIETALAKLNSNELAIIQ